MSEISRLTSLGETLPMKPLIKPCRRALFFLVVSLPLSTSAPPAWSHATPFLAYLTSPAQPNEASQQCLVDAWKSMPTAAKSPDSSHAVEQAAGDQQGVERQLRRLLHQSKSFKHRILLLECKGDVAGNDVSLCFSPQATLSLRTLLDWLERSSNDCQVKTTLLLELSTAHQDNAQRILSSLNESSAGAAPVSLLANVNACREHRFAKRLSRIVTFDRRADANGDGQLGERELLDALDVAAQSFRRLANSASPGSVLTYGTPSFTDAQRSVARSAYETLVHHGVKTVAVLPLVTADRHEPMRGIFSQAFTDQVRAQIRNDAEAEGAPQNVLDGTAIMAAIRQTDARPSTLLESLPRLASQLAPGDPMAFLLTNVERSTEGSDTGVSLVFHNQLFFCDESNPPTVCELPPTRFSMADHDLASLSRSERRALAMSLRVGGLNNFDLQPHPLLDATFQPRITVLVGERVVQPVFSTDKTQMYGRVRPGDEFTIRIENPTNRGYFLRLLVDGKNTRADNPGTTYGRLRPAVPVYLPHARCFYCAPQKVYHVPGFLGVVDTARNQAIAQRFTVVDTATQLEQPDSFFGFAGTITAAFYEPVRRSESSMARMADYAVEPGRDQTVTARNYTGNQGPGRLLHVMEILYGFEPPTVD